MGDSNHLDFRGRGLIYKPYRERVQKGLTLKVCQILTQPSCQSFEDSLNLWKMGMKSTSQDHREVR